MNHNYLSLSSNEDEHSLVRGGYDDKTIDMGVVGTLVVVRVSTATGAAATNSQRATRWSFESCTHPHAKMMSTLESEC
jgi:hypothetical protein